MGNGTRLLFNPFVLDTPNRSLLRGAGKIFLRPKTFAVLDFLVQNPHRLVTKDEMMVALWPEAKVVDAALRVSIQELRKALNDDAEHPRFIETVGKSGYRFIAPITLQSDTLQPGGVSLPTYMVGRQAELERLQDYLERANGGRRQVVFVTGEPGIGKTTLVGSFLSHAQVNDRVLTAQGQCIEQYGAGEAYLSILDALDGLSGRSSNGAAELLRRYAPSWLVNLPQLTDPTERAELERQTVGIAPERRLREIAAFLESLAAEQTVLLVLEDLHWLDPSTLALISFLARRRETARLMLIGTYREGEVERLNHPLKSVKEELALHHYCTHLPLKLLNRSAVGEYLGARFEMPQVAEKVTATVYRRSEGNPLFMVNVTDYLVGHGVIVQQSGSVELTQSIEKDSTPTTLSQLIERQFEALPLEDRTLLEVASVRGMSFCSAAVAAGLRKPVEEVEQQCEKLVEREQFLQPGGTGRWPDGTVFTRYGFIHALYQNVIYEQVTAARRARLHQTVGERLEAAYRGQTEEIATELALHFERAGDTERSLHYILQSAQQALRQGAHQEAVSFCARGFGLLEALSRSSLRRELETSFHLVEALSLTASQGYASTQAEQAFAETQHLSRHVRNDHLAFQALAGLWCFNLLHGNLVSSLKLAQDMLRLACRTDEWSYRLNGHMAIGCSLFYLGNILKAHGHLRVTGSQYDLERFRATRPEYSWDPGIAAACYDAMALWLLGYPAQAEHETQKAQDLASKLSNPFHSALTSGMLAMYYTYRGDVDDVLGTTQAAISISAENGFGHWLAVGTLLKGWALDRKGQRNDGVTLLTDGITKWQLTGAMMLIPTYLALKAEHYLKTGQIKKGLASIDEGLSISKKTKESYYDAELYRLKGELLLGTRENLSRKQQAADAENSFRQAIQTARRQKAKSLELRATVGLSRFWQRMGKRKEAYAMLAQVCAWFTEGLNSPDLVEALELLKQLL